MTDNNILAIIDTCEYDLVIKWRLTDLCNYKCSYCLRNWKDREGEKRITPTKERLQKEEDRAIKTSSCINQLIEKHNFKNVKIDLIGGEVSIFDLKSIISNITSPALKKIYITTNLSRNVDYYIDLVNYLQGRGIEISIMASYHSEFTSFDKYFEKIQILKLLLENYLKCEIVSRIDNQDDCIKFKDKCNKLDVNYVIEADLTSKEIAKNLLKDKGVSNNLKSKYVIINPNKDYIEYSIGKPKENLDEGDFQVDATMYRYLVIYQDGTIEGFGTRNMLLADERFWPFDQPYVGTTGFYCTHSINHIHIQYDEIIGRDVHGDHTKCRETIKIEDFEIPKLENCICHSKACSLCGNNISVSKDMRYLRCK